MTLSDGTSWVLVPRVATEEMRKAATDHAIKQQFGEESDAFKSLAWDIWAGHRAMLAAAPQPPVEEMVPLVAEILTEFSDVECSYDTIARAIVKRLVGE